MKKYFLLFLLCIAIFPAFRVIQTVHQRHILNRILEKAEYTEVKGLSPTFQVSVKTDRSTTHVMSYLSSELLPKEKFHADAAREVIEYVEKTAEERKAYAFNPYINNDLEIETRVVPRGKLLRENFVFLIPKDIELPGKLIAEKAHHVNLSNSIDSGRSFFWTQFKDKGSVSFLRFAESDTWKEGLPVVNQPGLTSIQQLNVGFNIEIWKRAVVIQSVLPKSEVPDYNNTLFGTSEILWNTFGQLVTAKQEGIDVKLMEKRLTTGTLSRKQDMRYYPFDEKARAIYEGAPTNPIIR